MQRGFHPSAVAYDQDTTLPFLRCVLTPDVRCQDFSGIDMFFQQWEFVTKFHAGVSMRNDSIHVLSAEEIDDDSDAELFSESCSSSDDTDDGEVGGEEEREDVGDGERQARDRDQENTGETLVHSDHHDRQRRRRRRRSRRRRRASPAPHNRVAFVIKTGGTTTCRISRDTLVHFFPHVLQDETLVQTLVGKEYEYGFTMVFHVNPQGRVFQFESQIDLATGLLSLLQDPFVTVKMIESSRWTKAGNLRGGELREEQVEIRNGVIA
ncbi:hypothetical protein PINS_up010658 [Pythium insidiosum]|nr:hypothetical protein PINS_up010658 [Pythium insidiosum]